MDVLSALQELTNVSHEQVDENLQGQPLAITGLPLSTPAVFPSTGKRRFYIETYGCQMNFNDSEIVASILLKDGFNLTEDYNEADLIFLNTCSIRDNAEQRVRKRLTELNAIKKRKPEALIGVLGCMAERLKQKFLEEEKMVDIVVGPDAYRDLPSLVGHAEEGQEAVNVLLSRDETYAEINPVRLNSNGVTAFVSIMRGCDNMCSFCVVPFTRGRERSRDPLSITAEARDLFDRGYREVTLLGQNVDSYKWLDEQGNIVCTFAQLLEKVALISPKLRVRFSTSHPKDMTDEVLYTMVKYHNICKYVHLPLQAGNSRVLQAMNRTYNREWYLNRVEAIRRIMPDCNISTDVIVGFCTETDDEFNDTISLMEYVKYDFAYMFEYSERPGTLAARKFTDDVPKEVKSQRITQVISMQRRHSADSHKADIGKVFEVLVEGFSKKSEAHLMGRNTYNKVVVFPKKHYKKGDYVMVKVDRCTSGTLLGEAID